MAKEAAERKAAVAAAQKAGTPVPVPMPGPEANLTAEGRRAAAAAPFSEVWASQPPNAAAVGAWGPDAKPRVVVVVLREPDFNAAAATLTFRVELLANHTAWPADEAPAAKGPDNTADADALEVAAASGREGGGGGGHGWRGGGGGAPATPRSGAAADAAAAAERRRAAGGGGSVASPPLVELGPDGEVRTRQAAVARDADGRLIPVGALRVAAAAASASVGAPPPPPRRRPVDLAEYTPSERAERAARAAAPAPILELAGPATLFIDNWGVGVMGPGWGPGSSNGGCILPPGCLSVGLCGICPRNGWGGFGGGLVG